MARLHVVGNATNDVIRTGFWASRRPGGTLLYATLALEALGHEARPVGYAPLRAYITLRFAGVDRSGLRLAFPGTRFLNEYDGSEREQWARRGPGQAIDDASLLDGAEGVLLGPVLGEVPPDLELPGGVPVLLDVQGMIRRLRDERTLLGYHPVEIEPGELRLPDATHVRGAIDELGPLLGTRDPEQAARSLHARTGRPSIVTVGPKGAVAFDGHELHRARLEAVDVEDPTGAGDVFDAGLLHALWAGTPLAEGIATGCAAASLFLQAGQEEAKLTERFPTREAIEELAPLALETV